MKKNKVVFSLLIVMLIMVTMVGSVSAAPWTWSGNFTNVSQTSYPNVREVYGVQVMCNEHNDSWLWLDYDASFGPLTEEAVEEFQEKRRITVDGKVGPQTWATMQGRLYSLGAGYYTVLDYEDFPASGVQCFQRNSSTNWAWKTNIGNGSSNWKVIQY